MPSTRIEAKTPESQSLSPPSLSPVREDTPDSLNQRVGGVMQPRVQLAGHKRMSTFENMGVVMQGLLQNPRNLAEDSEMPESCADDSDAPESVFSDDQETTPARPTYSLTNLTQEIDVAIIDNELEMHYKNVDALLENPESDSIDVAKLQQEITDLELSREKVAFLEENKLQNARKEKVKKYATTFEVYIAGCNEKRRKLETLITHFAPNTKTHGHIKALVDLYKFQIPIYQHQRDYYTSLAEGTQDERKQGRARPSSQFRTSLPPIQDGTPVPAIAAAAKAQPLNRKESPNQAIERHFAELKNLFLQKNSRPADLLAHYNALFPLVQQRHALLNQGKQPARSPQRIEEFRNERHLMQRELDLLEIYAQGFEPDSQEIRRWEGIKSTYTHIISFCEAEEAALSQAAM